MNKKLLDRLIDALDNDGQAAYYATLAYLDYLNTWEQLPMWIRFQLWLYNLDCALWDWFYGET